MVNVIPIWIYTNNCKLLKNNKKLFFLDFFTLKDGTERLSRNVGRKLLLYTAL